MANVCPLKTIRAVVVRVPLRRLWSDRRGFAMVRGR